MRILFTSDLHGNEKVYRMFSEILGKSEYSAGIITGDLMTHFTNTEIERLLLKVGAGPDDLLEELPEAEAVPEEKAESRSDVIYRRALRIRAAELQEIILAAGKPVFFIMGNDDGIVGGGLEWADKGLLKNANQRRIDFGDFNFTGYQYTPPFIGGMYEKPETEQALDLSKLAELCDSRTVLLTHGPPRGILDGDNYGSTALRDFVNKHPPYLHLFGHIHQSFGREQYAINGAFPNARKFVGIDLERRISIEIPVIL